MRGGLLGAAISRPVAVLAGLTMLVMFGVVEITLGIIAEVLIRMHYEIQGRAPYRIASGVGIEAADEER